MSFEEYERQSPEIGLRLAPLFCSRGNQNSPKAGINISPLVKSISDALGKAAPKSGGVAEWLMAPVLKTGKGKSPS